MNTETIDKLFLELSQFTQARTAREIALETDLYQWLQIAKRQQSWFIDHHPDGVNAGPCPTDAGIAVTAKLLSGK